MYRSFFEQYLETSMADSHDPLPRQLPTEPHFALMGRDSLSPGFARLYAIVRETGPDHRAKARAMLEAILLANDARDPRPHKDKDHAWSARAKADELEHWYMLNMQAKPQSGKLNSTSVVEDAGQDSA